MYCHSPRLPSAGAYLNHLFLKYRTALPFNPNGSYYAIEGIVSRDGPDWKPMPFTRLISWK